MKMEKIRKPTTNIFRLLFLLIGLTTLILSPLAIYSYFYCYGVPNQSHSHTFTQVTHDQSTHPRLQHTRQEVSGRSDAKSTQTHLHKNNVTFVDNLEYEDSTSLINNQLSNDSLNGAAATATGQYAGYGATPNGKNRLLETISKQNVAKLKKELIYIYKLPPVTDEDYEHEQFNVETSKHRKVPGGVWFFDDLDTDLASEKYFRTPIPHRFSPGPATTTLSSSIDNSIDNEQRDGSSPTLTHSRHSHSHHSRFDRTHVNVKADSEINSKHSQLIPQPLPFTVYGSQPTPAHKSEDDKGNAPYKIGDADKRDNSHSSGLPQPLPLPISTESASSNATHKSMPIVQIAKDKAPTSGGESTRKAKFYNTGHFRKSHAIIWDPHPQYIFHAFGHRFHLLLNLIPQKHSFLTPHFTITTHSSNMEFNNESFVWRENLKEQISGCFYNGIVLGDPHSSAAVSLCHGMTGHIRTSHGSYFIEPLPQTSYEYLERKKTEKSHQNNHTAGYDNDEQQVLHEIYQVGIDLPTAAEERKELNSDEDYSYESFDNLKIGSPTYDDEDEEDESWLNPGVTPKTRTKPKLEGKRRTKRSMSKERYVELSVVTDSTMSTYHGDNLKHYVLTLLSIVALIYKDASIGNPVNIALVSFHVLPDKSFASNQWTSENSTSSEYLPGISASEMLRNFCKWQKEHNNLDDKSPNHHDTALLLTRETICRNPWLHKCDTLGLAELGTMCDHYASCAIVQDNGLSAAFTIAHELGHVMNMPHDDDYKCQSFLDSQSNHPASSNHFHQQFSDSPTSAKEPQHYVMSRMLDHNTYPWAWSRCSRHFLTEFLDAGHGYCLEDQPGSNLLIGDGDNPDSTNLADNSTSPQQPGEIFSEHKQCELVFGPSSQLCSYMSVTKMSQMSNVGYFNAILAQLPNNTAPPNLALSSVWQMGRRVMIPYFRSTARCTTGTTTEEQEGCRTQHMPWADGTKCGTNNWCQRGACVKRDLEKLKTVNGGWGPWMEYGVCSRSCGGGVRKSYRECDHPRPSNGGKYCLGPRVRYESCSTHECPNEADYRAEQCAHFNNDNFNIQGLPKDITWVPKYHGISPKDRCKLFCRVQGSSSYYLLREKVVDGTPCGIDTFDVCVNGACLPAGCDRRLHSNKALDICGVCGGDGSTCRTTRGSFNESKYGYNSIIRIPAGASNIDIRQHSFDDTARDDNYLALVDSNEEYILNGHFVVSMFRKTLHYGGSILEYSGSDEVVERINSSSRPIKSDLILQVLSVGKLNPPDISYQYVSSLNYIAGTASRSSNSMEARWTHTDRWTSCTEICQGSQSQVQICSNSRTRAEISSEYCRNIGQLQDVKRQCNGHCSLKWTKIQKPCDCVYPNRTEVSFKCVRETTANKTYIADGYCSKVEKGEATSDCVEECSRPKWRWTQWSECSSRCGDGVQIRNVWCQKYNMHSTNDENPNMEQDNNYVALSDSDCGGGKPSARRKCHNGACGQWRIDQWSPCSTTCGQGISRGAYACYLEEAILPSDYCLHQPKPPLERSCEADIPCVEWAIAASNDHFVTDFGEENYWSDCTTRCSPLTGYRTRPVVCVIKQGNRKQSTKLKQVSENLCTRLLSTKPIFKKACDTKVPDDCYASSILASTKRSFYDSHARNRNSIENSNALDEHPIVSLPLVGDNSIDTDDDEYNNEWFTGAWSECFQSSGNVIKIREVTCPKERCREPRPPGTKTCGVWFTGEWEKCNSTCENRIGQETRIVRCVQADDSSNSADMGERECSKNKPESSRSCTSYCKPKGRWRTGPWGKCSRPCGVVESASSNRTRGQRIRQVVCVDETKPSTMLLEADCDTRTRPEASASCMDTDSQPCPVWSVSEWSECMATTTTAATTIAKRMQVKKLKPVKKKGTELCSNDINQDIMGHRERTVRCQDHNGHEIPEYHCRLLNKRPEHSEVCILSKKHCVQNSHYRWRVGNWSQCSKNCGSKGVKTRLVECTKVGLTGKLNTTIIVDEKFCQRGGKKRKPKEERGCARFHCPFKWIATDWSECSRTCGYGIQKRQVTCHRVNRLGWIDPDPVNACENLEKPKEYNYCMLSESCLNSTSAYSWKTEAWSECPPSSQFCDKKDKKTFQKRRVYCTVNGVRTPQRHCEKLGPKPMRKRRCPRVPCGWRSCLELKRDGNFHDGEYQMWVAGMNISIYCHGLNSDSPKEYLTLWEESISEIYDKRLIRPETCPRNGRRLDSCECIQDRNRRSGLTTWNKIRLNVTNLRVDTEDFTFTKSSGDVIPFGTSGDCYSSSTNCPQGRFSIDLRRTPLAVNSLTTWVSQGHKPTMQITKASDNQKVEGKCGGYCGTCSPNRITGLKLEVVQ